MNLTLNFFGIFFINMKLWFFKQFIGGMDQLSTFSIKLFWCIIFNSNRLAWRRLSKNVDHHGWPTAKKLKNAPAKTPYLKYKWPKYKWFKISCFAFFFEILFQACNLFILCQMFQWTSEFFLILDFLAEGRKANKLANKITHFTKWIRSKCLTSFRNLSSLDVDLNLLDLQREAFLAWNFSRKHNSVWCHSWNTLKAIFCIFLRISVKNVLFERHSKILLSGSGFGVKLDYCLKGNSCFGLVKCFTIFLF